MRRGIVLGGALVLVLAAGLVHGLWTDRWSTGEDLPRAVARLEAVPLRVGDWEGQDRSLQDAVVERAGLAGYLNRPYTHRESKQTVLLLLLCGRFGPISVHTPDVCYGGVGYVLHDTPRRFELKYAPGRPPAQLWTARFHKPSASDAAPLRIFWSWNAEGPWLAPDYPRVAFRRSPALFKLYVVREMSSLTDPLETDPSLDFLRVLLPAFEATSAPVSGVFGTVNDLNKGCSEFETAFGRWPVTGMDRGCRGGFGRRSRAKRASTTPRNNKPEAFGTRFS